jgi:hypothetical protein
LNDRLIGFFNYAIAASERMRREIERLRLLEIQLQRRFQKSRKTSKLPALADLILRKPYVSASIGARHLKVTERAVRDMMIKLQPVVREMTGRSSYRLWGI